MKTINLRKGEEFSHKGKKYRVNKSVPVKVSTNRKTDSLTEEQKIEILPLIGDSGAGTIPDSPEVQGESKRDPAQAIDKATVLGLIQKEIDKLKKHENDLLMEGIFDVDDDLDLIDQQRGENYKTANYAATAVHVMTLKTLYKTIQKLS